MFYVADENEPNPDGWEKWKYWIIFIGVLLTLLFAIFMTHISPDVTPPISMKSSDPYWYSGE